MPEPTFHRLRKELRRGGVSPRYIERTISELQDHYADIESAALDRGLPPEEAAAAARRGLGTDGAIAAAVLSEPSLKTWAHRWPRTAGALVTTAWVAVLPVVPFVYCAQRGEAIARWGLSASLAVLMTGALLLGMHSLLSPL